MATLARATHAVKSNITQFLPGHVIRDAAAAVEHRYRDRKLGPVEAVLTLVLQLVSANASLAHARATAGGYAFTPSALCQARARLPLALLARVLDWLVEQAADATGGPRVLLIDAFNCYVPDAPGLRRQFHRPRQQRSRRGADYPQMRTLGVFDLRTGMLVAQHHFAADRHESPQLLHVLSAIARPGDIVVFDRGFVSYANLCLLRAAGMHVVARLARKLSARRGTHRTREARLGKGDVLVRWAKPERRPPGCPLTRTRWARLPGDLHLRQVTTSVRTGRCRRVMLITDLTDPLAHPASVVSDWYRRRWEVETDVRHLKQTMNLEFLRARTPGNVERELVLRAIAYNLVRLAMLRAAELRGITDPGRVSFADACRWLATSSSKTTGDAAAAVSLLRSLLINPKRTRTTRPRKLKYRGKNYGVLKARPASQRSVA